MSAAREGKPIQVVADGRQAPVVAIPGELLTVYQPRLGPQATLLWINLRALTQAGRTVTDLEAELAPLLALPPAAVREAFSALLAAGLLEARPDGAFALVNPAAGDEPPVRPRLVVGRPVKRQLSSASGSAPDPLAAVVAESLPRAARQGSVDQEAFPMPPPQTPGTEDRTAREPAASVSWHSKEAALRAVIDFYQKRIGMLGPMQEDRLRFWVEDKQMAADVIAAAIEETATNAEMPRMEYLEGILRNWWNKGIRTYQDLDRNKRFARILGKADAGSDAAGHAGAPNAGAYRDVDPELVRWWKELYADEYDGA